MPTVSEAPQQYKQPSRKGKRAWRKNVDLSEVQEGLRILRDEEIQGGVVREKPSEELFAVDTAGSVVVQKMYLRHHKPLKSDEILAQRSAIPAVDSRKRPNSRVTDGIVEPKRKRPKGYQVTNKEWLRLKRAARDASLVSGDAHGPASYDPWFETPSAKLLGERSMDFLRKPKPIVAPPTLKRPPISLAANGKLIPSVPDPGGGISYNPVFQDWDNLLTKEGHKELAVEKQRQAEEKQELERLARIAAEKDDGAESDVESAWEGCESEYETPEWLTKKRPERKTKAQRNKMKRRKEAEQRAKWEAQMRKREMQVTQVRPIAKAIKAEEDVRRKLREKAKLSSDEGDDRVLRRRPLGKYLVPVKPLEIVLPDELQDSLRLLKPEGNLLDDRFRSLLVQGKLEARRPIVQSKRAKKRYTEMWAYKDFKLIS